jgi:peptidoglycan hydrolase-like protein with peptidoglycan-binding domain
MAKDDVAERLRAGGILAPRMVIQEAKRAGLRLDYACAMLQKESGGGKNVFGHDPTIFVGAGTVTKAKYLDYKRKRVASGNDQMQGVGPTQLTYWTLQDRADAQGGCWKPRINMRVGFKHLADHIRNYGESDGARRYNGSGDAAVAYSKDLLAKAAKWREVLDGAAPVVVPTGPQPLKAGARGPEVVRLTRRLSRLRSKAGTPYLDKPRKTLDAAAEGALKSFQAEHRLVADGVFGPLTQRKLNRALRLQAKRAKEKKAGTASQTPATPTTTTTTRPAKRGRTFKTLVEAVHEADAETGEAWDALVAHAAKRRRVLARATKKVASRPPEAAAVMAEGFAAVTQELRRINGTLDGIAEDLEAQEGRVATVAASEPVATGGGGGAPPVDIADGPTVVQTAPPEPPPNEGPAPPSPAAADPAAESRRRELVDLSDDELIDRIARLDRALDRSRAVLIRRYIEVEKDLARIAPQHKEKTPPKDNVKVKPTPTPTPRPEPVRPGPSKLTREQVRELQTALNAFSSAHLVGMGPLIVDGVMGPATKKRIRLAKHYLGYTGTARKTIAVDDELLARLRHPRSARHSSPRMLSRALRRRRKQRKAAKVSRAPRAGVDSFDGEPVAAWMKPYLEWAREHGWKGTLNSGWRDPVHSERLCFDICGAPKCSGRCAGRSSNHVGNVKPAGSIDVSDPATFGALMKKCPYEPKIFNALGARDPWHFSASGR